ncbi:hypothetical protein ABZ605_29390 [Streptomyces sp. NPDC012765]|uniref:hypothetical protein n=1 Tax=Streptomyces sp. NPDC012765 TaxID=3155249 RepID=UPI0033F106D7
MAELVKICDPGGRARGSGFVADDRGTVVTSHEAVDGLTRVVLHAPGPTGRTWLAEGADVTVLPGLALALVRTDGLGVRPLPVALREVIDPGTYVRLLARGWRQARVLGGAQATYPAAERTHAVPAGVAVELAIGTDGRDALRLGGEACGGPVLDAGTGAVLAVLGTALRAEHRSGGFAVALRAAAGADPDGPLADLLERNAATVPGHGADLNLAGALELTATTLGASLRPEGPEPVERPAVAAELAAFTAGDRPVLGLVGEPGTGRTTELAALAVRRAHGARPAPTLWLRGADLRVGDTSLADAATRALTTAARIVATADAPPPPAPHLDGHPPNPRPPAPNDDPGAATDPGWVADQAAGIGPVGSPSAGNGGDGIAGPARGPIPSAGTGIGADPGPIAGRGWVAEQAVEAGASPVVGPPAGTGTGAGLGPAFGADGTGWDSSPVGCPGWIADQAVGGGRDGAAGPARGMGAGTGPNPAAGGQAGGTGIGTGAGPGPANGADAATGWDAGPGWVPDQSVGACAGSGSGRAAGTDRDAVASPARGTGWGMGPAMGAGTGSGGSPSAGGGRVGTAGPARGMGPGTGPNPAAGIGPAGGTGIGAGGPANGADRGVGWGSGPVGGPGWVADQAVGADTGSGGGLAVGGGREGVAGPARGSGTGPDPAAGTGIGADAGPAIGADRGGCWDTGPVGGPGCDPGPVAGRGWVADQAVGAGTGSGGSPAVGTGRGAAAALSVGAASGMEGGAGVGVADWPAPAASTGSGAGPATGAGAGGGAGIGIGEQVARLAAGAGRGLLVVLDAPEEMPPELAHRLGPWTAATAEWLRGTGARLVVAARPEYWERAGALYPPGALHTPARPARRLPPALPLADLTAAEAETARARLGIPADAVREADARHPLTLHLLAGIRAAEVTAGRPGRDEVFAAHLDLLCLRAAVRIAAACADAGGARVHGPGVRRLAARVAGRVHEAARRALGPGQGQLDRAAFEELFPWRTGWASAVLTEGLLVPAGPGYRFAHEELSDWIQAGHLDVPTALGLLVHGPAVPGLPVPRHRIGPVLEALRRLAPDPLRRELTALVDRLNRFAEEEEQEEETGQAPDRVWWAARLLRETLLRAPDARPHLPVLHALAEHVARAGPGEFGGWFWNRLRLPEPDRLDLLRRLLPADPAEAVPGDRYLDAAARRLARDPQRAQPLLCAWFTDGRRLRGRPGATVATAAQALLHTHRGLAPDDLTEALVTAAHPHADELLAVLAEEEPSALCRAVDRWAHDERPERRVAAAAYGLATAPHVRTPADRELLRRAARALLARPADATLHGSALAILLRDPHVRGRYLPDALACFRDPELGSRLPAEALVAALPVLPDPDEVFAALRARADGEVVRALAALTTPGLARRAGDLVREHLARHPGDAPHAAFFVDRRLDQGPAAASVVRPLVLDLLLGAPAVVRAELALVLAAPGGEASHPLRGDLADTLLREEADPQVLDVFLGAVAAGASARPEDRTRELLRRTGRQLLRAPGGPAVFERRTVELARAEPAFGALVARWLVTAEAEAAALLGPSARRTVETLSRAAADVT